ncbi:hypothetical protein DLM75_12460 [Leptospira stimsonii]|uniref:Uncharacterized protein n=1 Tax=Leptospira stimsonii TaxID=2202203 RepID=A0A396Z808_9LEPT|nr:hypothetical protein DLM75_12460 [Leptospira stimsonii]
MIEKNSPVFSTAHPSTQVQGGARNVSRSNVGTPTRKLVEKFFLEKAQIRDREKLSRFFHRPPLHPSSGWGAKRFTVKHRNSDNSSKFEFFATR